MLECAKLSPLNLRYHYINFQKVVEVPCSGLVSWLVVLVLCSQYGKWKKERELMILHLRSTTNWLKSNTNWVNDSQYTSKPIFFSTDAWMFVCTYPAQYFIGKSIQALTWVLSMLSRGAAFKNAVSLVCLHESRVVIWARCSAESQRAKVYIFAHLNIIPTKAHTILGIGVCTSADFSGICKSPLMHSDLLYIPFWRNTNIWAYGYLFTEVTGLQIC